MLQISTIKVEQRQQTLLAATATCLAGSAMPLLTAALLAAPATFAVIAAHSSRHLEIFY